MTVATLLKTKPTRVISVPQDAALAEAVRLLVQHEIGGLPVVDRQGKPVGFLSERDIVRAMDVHSNSIRKVPVREAMRRPPPLCCPEDRLQEVMRRMTRQRFRHLVVTEEEEILGVISVGDLVKQRLEQLETETEVLRDYVAGQRARR